LDDSEHEALLKFLKNLQGMVVLSGYECDLYSDLLAEWRKFTRKTFAAGARERTEVLWLSPNCSKELNAV
jgi:DNA adenine methylase